MPTLSGLTMISASTPASSSLSSSSAVLQKGSYIEHAVQEDAVMSSDNTLPLEDASALAGLNHQAGVRWLGGLGAGASSVACTTGVHINDPALCCSTTYLPHR